MYNVHIEVESLVYIYVYVGSRTIFSPVSRTRGRAYLFHIFLKKGWIGAVKQLILL